MNTAVLILLRLVSSQVDGEQGCGYFSCSTLTAGSDFEVVCFFFILKNFFLLKTVKKLKHILLVSQILIKL